VLVGYTPLRSLLYFPINTEIDPGAETYSYDEWDQTGVAKIIANYADDLPMVDVVVSEVTGKIRSLGDGYQYSRQDLRAAAKSGRPLPARKRLAARAAVDRLIDRIAAVGDAPSKLRGVLTHPNLPILGAAAPGTGSDSKWNGGDKTAKEVLSDMMALDAEVGLNTHENRFSDSLLLPPTRLAYISGTPYGAAENSDSILTVFKKNAQNIRNIASWHKLETAGEDGGPAALTYWNNPQALQFMLVLPFTEYEPQIKGLAFQVPCEARVGGMAIYEPLSLARMDGI